MAEETEVSLRKSSRFSQNQTEMIFLNAELQSHSVVKEEPLDLHADIIDLYGSVDDCYCRVCFCIFSPNEDRTELDQSRILLLHEILNVKIRIGNRSRWICEKCTNLVDSFKNFKQNVIEKQARFAQLLVDEENFDLSDIQKISTPDQFEDSFGVKDESVDAASLLASHEKSPVRRVVKKANYSKTTVAQQPQGSPPIKKNKSSQFCPYCEKYICNLNDHIGNVHLRERNYFCDLCSFSSYYFYAIESHILNVHLPKTVKCPSCDFKTINQKRLQKHIRNIHEIGKHEGHPCPIAGCDRRFQKKGYLNDHVRRAHDKIAQFKCEAPDCERYFYTRSEQRAHYQNCHAPKVFICDECGKGFGTSYTLQKHATVHKESQYACDSCSEKFRTSAALKIHVNRVHLDNPEFKCSGCDKAFFSSSLLEKHVRSKHSGIKFQCQVPGCKSVVARRDTYLTHLKTHRDLTGEARQEVFDKLNEFCRQFSQKK